MADRDIDRQLNRTRRDVKIVDLFSSLMILAAGVVALLLLAAVVDHWILPLATWARWLLLAVLVVGSTAYFSAVLLPLLLRSINPLYAARAIEQSEPSLKNSVINFLLFREDRAGVRAGVYEALKQRAALDLSHVPPESAVDRTRLIHIGYGLIGVLVLFAAYTILSPKSPLQTARRVAAPWADIARPTRVRIEEVEPGNREVFYGERIAVWATCYDLYPDEPVTLIYSSLDGRITEQRLRMQAGSAGLRYQALLPPDDEGIQQDLIYRVQAGDAASAAYRLNVLPAPTLLVQQLDYEYPAYTGQPNRVVERQGDVKGVEGTRVTVHARANQPIRWAALLLHRGSVSATAPDRGEVTAGGSSGAANGAPPESVSMSFDGQRAWGSFVLQLDGAGRLPKHAAYQLRFETLDGHPNVRAPLHRIEVTRDLTPEIEILTPAAERIELPLDRLQKIEVRAIDPDYGLRTISLRALAGGTELVSASLLDDPAGRTGQWVGSYDFKPWEHGLNPGDTLVYWGLAADNRVSPQTGEPEPNLAKTKTYHVTILPPEKSPGDPQRPEEERDPSPSAESPPASQEPAPGGADDAAASEAAEQTPQEPDSGGAGQEPGQQGDSAGAGGESGDGSHSSGSSGQQQGGAAQSAPKAGGDSADQSGGGSGQAGGSPTGKSAAAAERSENGGAEPGSSGETPAADSPAGDGTGSASPGETADSAAGRQQSGGEATATGRQATGEEPLHDGEVIEKTLEYIRSQQERDASPQAGGQGDEQPEAGPTAEQQIPDGGTPEAGGTRPEQAGPGGGDQDTPEGASAEDPSGQSPAGSQEPQQTQTGDQTPGGAQQQPDRSQGAGQQRDGSAAEGGMPQGAAETRPEESPAGADSGQPRQGGLGDSGDSGEGQASEDPSGSAEAQKENRDQEKQGEGGDPKPQPSDGAQSPSQSKRQRDLPGGAAGDQSGEGNKGAGQGAGQEGSDSPGSQSSADDGAGAAQESGAGDTAPRPGTGQVAADPTHTPGTQEGSGSSTQPAPGSSGVGGRSPDAASQTDPKPGGEPTSQASDDPGQGLPLGGGHPGPADFSGSALPGEVPPGEEPNLEYTRRSTEMVLEYLKDQQQKLDPALLDQLGWKEDDLRQFLQRWEALRAAAGRDEQARREMNDALRSLGLRPGQATRRATGPRDELHGLRENGAQSSPPLRYLEQFNAYKKGTARVDE